MTILEMCLSLLKGFGNTVLLFIVTLIIAIPLGLAISFLSMSKVKVIRTIARIFISIIRGTPLMLQLILVFYGPGLLFGAEYGVRDIEIFGYCIFNSGRMIAAMIAFGINYAAYFSEIFRGGIESIPNGQREAGQVLGMTKSQIFSKVIMLQVIKNILPPMSNEIITLVKDTSLARMITVVELTDIAFDMRKERGGTILPLIAAGVFYYIANAIVAFILRKIEKKLSYFRT